MLLFEIDVNLVEKVDGITNAFPYAMHRRDLTSFIVPWHWHEEVEFNYVAQGAITVQTMNASYTMRKDEAFFINTNVMCMKRKADGADIALECAHIFHPILLAGHFQSVFETKYTQPILRNRGIDVIKITRGTQSGEAFLNKLYELSALCQTHNKEMEIRCLLSEAWLKLMEEIRETSSEQSTGMESEQRIRIMISYIHQHYPGKISLGDIAASAGVSVRECNRCFQKCLHQTPIEYLISYRIEKAKELLVKTDISVTEVAYRTGFSDSAYFSKVFRAATQVSPKQYAGHYTISGARMDQAPR